MAILQKKPRREHLFIIRFSDGSENGQIKAIKKDEHGNWLACDIDINENVSNCQSMASFSLTGVSLDDLLFIELYLKNDPGNVLWKWYMNLEIEFMFLNALDGSRSNVFLPTDGSDPTKHRVLLVKANGKLGKSIDVSVAVKDLAGTLNHPPDPQTYPPASVDLKMVRYSDDPKSVNYDYYVLENDAPIIVTDGTMASIVSGFAGYVLYDPPLHCVSAGLAATFDAGGFHNIFSKDARACIFTPRLKLDVNYPDNTEQDVKSFVLRWRPELPPRHDTQFWVRLDGLHPIEGTFDHYLIEVDEGGPELPPFGRARSLGRGQRKFYVDSAGQTSFSLSFLDQVQVPEEYRRGCRADNAAAQRLCVRPYRMRFVIFYVSDNGPKQKIDEWTFHQSIQDTIFQEYWDHYLYPAGDPLRRITCKTGNRHVNQGGPDLNGICSGDNVHPWPTSEIIVFPQTSTNYTAAEPAMTPTGCGAGGASDCRTVVSANYFNLAGSWMTRGNPLRFAEQVRTQYQTIVTTVALTPRVTSGWRNPERNEAAGGAINSWHQWGEALDMIPAPSPLNGIVLVYDDTQNASRSWCQLATAAYGASNNSPAELFIENRRPPPPLPPDTPDPRVMNWNYHTYSGSTNTCVQAVQNAITTCLSGFGEAPYSDAEKTSCSPDHVHVVRR